MCKIEKTNERGVSSIDHNHKQYKRRDTPMREKFLTNLKLSDLWKEFKTNTKAQLYERTPQRQYTFLPPSAFLIRARN